MQFSFGLVVVPFFLCTVLSQNEDDYYKREHSLTKPYQGKEHSSANYNFVECGFTRTCWSGFIYGVL